MKINHQINLFFEYKMANRLLDKIEKELILINKDNKLLWKMKKEHNEKAKTKWLKRKEEILEEWNSSNDYYIDEFPYVRKEEILKYYNHPSRRNDRNPFLDYYK